MTERHGGQVTFRSAPAVSGGRRDLDAKPDPSEWREAANGKPEPLSYVRRDDAAREAQVAAQVAAIRAEALRNARERLGDVPLQRRASGGRWITWDLVEGEGEPS